MKVMFTLVVLLLLSNTAYADIDRIGWYLRRMAEEQEKQTKLMACQINRTVECVNYVQEIIKK